MSNFDFEPQLLDHDTDSSLFWTEVIHPTWTLFFRIILILSTFIITCMHFIFHLQPSQNYEWKRGQFNEEVLDENQIGLYWDIKPNMFPFPDSNPPHSQKKVTFNIPDAEFTLSVKIPTKWKKVNVRSDMVRFGTSDLLEGELKFSNTYSDREPTIEENIATSLEQHITVRDYYNQSLHVLHWHIHHQTWLEYSFLYEDPQGQSWMHGVSLRWNPEWLNVIKCQYIAPVYLPKKNKEVLHFAWDTWVSQFIHQCRK